MKPTAWRWRRGVRVEALGDLAREAPVGNRPLALRQQEAFAACGIAVRDVDDPAAIRDAEFLLFADNFYASPALLRDFLAAARAIKDPGVLQLALREDAFTALAQFTGEQPPVEDGAGGHAFRFGLYLCRGVDATPAGLEGARPVLVSSRARDFTLPFSSRISTMTDLHVPVTHRVAFELTSWVHLWLANLYFIYVSFRERLRSPARWPGLLARALAGLALAGSLRPFHIALSVLRRMSLKGRGCRIHPTALVEASVLGGGVDVGPHCIVRCSILGDGVRVMEQSIVDGSVLGDGVLVNPQGMVKLTVAYPRASFTWIQACVVGESTFLGVLCRALEMKFEGEVKVRHRGELVNTGLPFLGSCIGHRAFISADTRIAPGRVLPNDYKVLTDDSRHVRDVPEGLPHDHLLVERDGVITPLRATRVKDRTRPS